MAAASVSWTRAADAGLQLRPMAGSDMPFLAQVDASTRTEELALAPGSEAGKQAFLASQFQAQHAHYQRYYPDADWLVVSCDGNDIGRLYLE
ncbi:hypothetical protein, partial [Acinetobacter baumannii]|uniref:hypothetical protein n=1 Tax=Acinetobacter baumannii TaxID=470 RepID=UPI001D1760B2